MRTLLRIAFALFIVIPSVVAAQETATINADRISMRATASVDAAIVNTLPKGAKVTILERQDAWVKISTGSQTGWVRSTSVTTGASPANPASTAAPSSTSQPPTNTQTTARAPSTAAPAQQKPAPVPGTGFEVGHYYVGPRISIGNAYSTPIGATFEYAWTEPGRYGPGMVGLAATIDHYSFNFDDLGDPDDHFSVTAITGSALYHFVLDDKRIDPFVGLGLGIFTGGFYGSVAGSATFLVAQGGVRYFFTPRVAAEARLGGGLGTLGVGVTWKF